MARRGFLPWLSDVTSSTSWQGGTGPDPIRPADYGETASRRRADRYVGTGQPRQEPDPQRLRRGGAPNLAVVADERRPLARRSPAGGTTVAVVDFRAPDPVGSAQVRSVDAMYGAGQAGELGEVRWGMPGMPRDAVYDGELGRLQAMHGAQTVAQNLTDVSPGANRSTFRGGMLSGLPGTTGLADMPLSDAQAVLIQTSGYWG